MTEPFDPVVEKFRDDIGPDAIPLATLSMLWFINEDGTNGVLSQFDGEQQVSVTVGDLTALIHVYLHADEEAQ